MLGTTLIEDDEHSSDQLRVGVVNTGNRLRRIQTYAAVFNPDRVKLSIPIFDRLDA